MTPVLDLARRHFHFQKSGLSFIGTWARVEETIWRPALVIIRTGEEHSPLCVPCVVNIDNAWIWDETRGDEVVADYTAKQFALALRLDITDERVIRKLRTLIHDLIPDLFSIPPFNPATTGERQVLAELTITDPAGRTTEALIHDV